MARKLRVQLPNVTYHIISRCIEWKNYLQEDYFKACFVEILNRAKQKYHFKLIAYCIMDNHIHLDSSSIGWGCCCLQVTFQASSFYESLYLYDQLIPLTPIFVYIQNILYFYIKVRNL